MSRYRNTIWILAGMDIRCNVNETSCGTHGMKINF